MQCPKCEGTLAPLVIDGVEVDRCGSCQGIWFDKRELADTLPKEAAVKVLDGKDTQGFDQKRGQCPKDKTALMRVNSARNHKVTLDTCTVCQGIWLDGGEFAALREGGGGIPFLDLL